MNNEIGRKLTSLTLMTIMFAGGLTIAAPTMFPETDAQSSSMLSVSTTSLQGGAILEIVVDDPDLKILDSPISAPLVQVNGNHEPVMVQAVNGKWYAYVADKSQVEANEGISAIGWDYGNAGCTSGIGSGGTASIWVLQQTLVSLHMLNFQSVLRILTVKKLPYNVST